MRTRLTVVGAGCGPQGDRNAFKVFALQDVKLLPWNDKLDEQNMLNALRQGTIAALVIDAPFADYMTSINCDLYEVGAGCCAGRACHTPYPMLLHLLRVTHPQHI